MYPRFTEVEIVRRIKAGYGSGVGQLYKPWFEKADFPANSYASEQLFLTNGAVGVVFGNIEMKLFTIADLCLWVDEARTQYPENRERTRSIAIKRGIPHPKAPGTGVDTVMTLDNLLFVKKPRNKSQPFAVHCKPIHELDDPVILGKLEISRYLWKEEDQLPWLLLTDKDIPEDVYKNALWLRAGVKRMMEPGFNPDEDDWVSGQVLAAMKLSRHKTAYRVTNQLDVDMGLERGRAMNTLCHMLLRAPRRPVLRGTHLPTRVCEALDSIDETFYKLVG